MSSCILASYLVVAWGLPALAQQNGNTSGPATIARADALYAHREDPASARQAVEIYEKLSPTEFEAAWKLARACYWIATNGPDKERGDAREKGVKAGQLAAKLNPSKPEGDFWMAANLGEVADHSFIFTAKGKATRVREALERVLKMDPAWQAGSADRALGEWYFRVPGIAGGDDAKAEEHLRASLKYDQASVPSLFFLGEVLADNSKRKDEAKRLLQQALDAHGSPEWAPEDRQFKAKATALLAKLNKK